jgi:hypothetical protein
LPLLAAAIGAADTQITVIGTLPEAGTIRIDDELITFTARSGNTLTGVTRGVRGTTAAAHAAGSAIEVVGQPGDANCDAFVTAADLLGILAHLEEGTVGPCGADASGDGMVTSVDLRATIAGVFAPGPKSLRRRLCPWCSRRVVLP